MKIDDDTQVLEEYNQKVYFEDENFNDGDLKLEDQKLHLFRIEAKSLTIIDPNTSMKP